MKVVVLNWIAKLSVRIGNFCVRHMEKERIKLLNRMGGNWNEP